MPFSNSSSFDQTLIQLSHSYLSCSMVPSSAIDIETGIALIDSNSSESSPTSPSNVSRDVYGFTVGFITAIISELTAFGTSSVIFYKVLHHKSSLRAALSTYAHLQWPRIVASLLIGTLVILFIRYLYVKQEELSLSHQAIHDEDMQKRKQVMEEKTDAIERFFCLGMIVSSALCSWV